VKFRADPPDPIEFPRFKLLWPLVVPIVVGLVTWGAERGGHTWNIHGDAIALILVFFAGLVVGLVALLFTLPQAFRTLLRFSSLRTPSNFVATGLAIAFILVAAFYILYAIFKVSAS